MIISDYAIIILYNLSCLILQFIRFLNMEEMESNTTSVFEQLGQGDTMYQPRVLLADLFKKKSTQFQTKYIILTETNLLQYEDSMCLRNPKICTFTFETRFEVLRNDWKNPKILPLAIGLRLQKQGRIAVQLYHEDPAVILKWKQLLEKKINVKGFHQLFKPIKKLGKGNYASVYLAERLEDNRLVAVKSFLKDTIFSKQKGKQLLKNEIQLMRRMNHNNIVKLYSVYQSNNSLYLIMEYLEGDLLLQNKKQLTDLQIKTIMKDLLKGLQYMHLNRIMHRDLKPENILLKTRHESHVAIADLGLATSADDKKYIFSRCGTPGFVAPQILRLGPDQNYEPICDIFSAGAIFHLLLTGKYLFDAKTLKQLFIQNTKCEFNFNSDQYQQISNCAINLMTRMLDVDPKSRISAGQALNHMYFNTQMEIQSKQNLNTQYQTNFKKANYKEHSKFAQQQTNRLSILRCRDANRS